MGDGGRGVNGVTKGAVRSALGRKMKEFKKVLAEMRESAGVASKAFDRQQQMEEFKKVVREMRKRDEEAGQELGRQTVVTSRQMYLYFLMYQEFTKEVPGVNLANVDPESNRRRIKLSPFKLYLDSCATYHTMFETLWLENIHKVDRVMQGHCNAGVTTSDTVGELFGLFKVWINGKGIANLLPIPQLEEDGYRVKYDTLGEWEVFTPQGDVIQFERDTGLCGRMSHLDLRKHTKDSH